MNRGADGLRIVSVLPAATETVFALGAGADLVGVSHACDHPEAARRLPCVSRPRVDPNLPSAELDAAVKATKHRGESLYELDADLLRRLRPTHILSQVQCDVCAVTPKDLEAAVRGIDPRPEIVSLESLTLEGVLEDTKRLGALLGRAEEARLVLFRQWRLIKEIRSRVRDLGTPRIVVLDWVDPPMVAGHWMPELVGIAGGQYLLRKPGEASRWTSWEEIEEAEPDVLVAAPCGREVDATRQELLAALSEGRPGDLAAYDDGRVWVADGSQFFNRPGPRLVYSAALLARALHPEDLPVLPEALEQHLERLRP